MMDTSGSRSASFSAQQPLNFGAAFGAMSSAAGTASAATLLREGKTIKLTRPRGRTSSIDTTLNGSMDAGAGNRNRAYSWGVPEAPPTMGVDQEFSGIFMLEGVGDGHGRL